MTIKQTMYAFIILSLSGAKSLMGIKDSHQ